MTLHAIRGNFAGSVKWLPDGDLVEDGLQIAARRRGPCGDPGQWTGTTDGHYDFAGARPPPYPINNWGVEIACYQPFADGPVTQAFDLACFGLNPPADITVSSTSSSQTTTVDMSCWRPEKEPPIGPSPPPSPAPNTPCSAPGRPVEVTNGNVHIEQTDAAVPGIAAGGLTFVRRYNSINAADPERYGVFGPGWYHNYEKRIASYDATLDVIKLREADGGPRYFRFARLDDDDRIYVASVPFTSESLIRKKQDGTFVREFRRGGSEQYAALPSGRLTAIVDPSGNTVTLQYFSDRLVITDPGSRQLTLTYVSASTITLSGPAGLIATFTTSGSPPALSSVVYADGDGDSQADGSFSFDYGVFAGARRLTEIRDGTNRVIETHDYYASGTYQGWGRTSAVSGEVEKLEFVYEPTRTTVTDSLGRVTTYQFSQIWGQKLVTRIDGPCNCGGSRGDTHQEWTYDDKGRVASYSDGEGYLTTYTYDPATGDLLSEMKPIDLPRTMTHVTSYTYWPDNSAGKGRLHTRTDPNGGVTTYTYGPAGPLTITEKITATQERTTTIQYTAAGKPQYVDDPLSNRWELSFNSAGDLEWIKDPTPAHNQTSFRYDLMGRLEQVTRPPVTGDPLIVEPVTSYDTLGRVWRILNPDGSSTRIAYDGGGRRETVTDALNRVTRYFYDDYGRLETVRDAAPTPGDTVFGYDLMSNLTSITDARRKTTRFVIDGYNRVQTICYHPGDPCTRWDHFTYDGKGQVSQKTDRRGMTTTYSYDGLGRLTGKTYSDGTSPAVFRYDEGAASQKGRLTSASAGGIDLAWVYNLVGDLTEARRTKGQVVRMLAYDYWLDSKREKLWLDSQLLARYDWEERRLPLRITREATQDRIYEFTHDAASRRKTLLFPNAVQTTYSYDERSRLKGIVAAGQSTVLDVTYPTHDLVGNRTSRGGTTLPAEGYNYDELYRLWYVTQGQPETERYSYDAVGNRLTSLQAPAPPWTYDDWNQLTSKPGATFAYDLNGNLSEKVEGGITWTYEWDAENRLKRVRRNQVEVATYVYDALGRRAERLVTDGLKLHEYVYDGEDIVHHSFTSPLIEGDLVDPSVHIYLHGPGIDEPLEVEHGVGDVWFYHADGLGSIVRATDTSQTIRQSRAYDSFGNPLEGGDQDGYAFTGREWDSETGLYYYRARYHDPKIGRFVSEDPIGFEGGVNFYAYVLNNPINLIDPSGLDGGSGMGWPGHRGPGPKPPTWYDTWSDWYQRGDQVGWRYAHCMASCETAGHSGQTTAKAAGYANEIRQTLRCWTFSPGDCDSAWADTDFKDNERGYTCPTEMSCEDRCGRLRGRNKRPNQYGPFSTGR